MESEIIQLIGTLHIEMGKVNRSIGDLVDRLDAERAKRTLKGVRQCMLVINSLYELIDMTPIYRESDLIQRCYQSMHLCQEDLERVFAPFSHGLPVNEDDIRRLALDWMDFHQNHVDLTDYIQFEL